MTREQCRIGAESHRILSGWLAAALPSFKTPSRKTAKATPLAGARYLAAALEDLALDVIPEGFDLLHEKCRTVRYLLEDPCPDMLALNKAAHAVQAELKQSTHAYLVDTASTGFFDRLEGADVPSKLRRDYRARNPTWRADQLDILRKQLNPFLYVVPTEDPTDPRTQLDAAMQASLDDLSRIDDVALRLRVALRKRMSDCLDSEERWANVEKLAARTVLETPRGVPGWNPKCFEYETKWAAQAQLLCLDRATAASASPEDASDADDVDPAALLA